MLVHIFPLNKGIPQYTCIYILNSMHRCLLFDDQYTIHMIVLRTSCFLSRGQAHSRRLVGSIRNQVPALYLIAFIANVPGLCVSLNTEIFHQTTDVLLLLFVLYRFRLTIRANCPMYLGKYPMDTQYCPILIGSCK